MPQYGKQHTESSQQPHRKERQTCTEVTSEHLWMVACKGDSCLAFKIVFGIKKIGILKDKII